MEGIPGSTEVLQPLVDLADRLGLLEAVKGKLIRQPDKAARELGTALLELEKIFNTLDYSITQYLAVSIDPDQPSSISKNDLDTLNSLAFGAGLREMRAARSRCRKIWNIYLRYLNPWFARALATSEQDLMKGLFTEFMEADLTFVNSVEYLAEELERDAQKTLSLAQTDSSAANKHIKKRFGAYWPLRIELSKSSDKIRALEGEFIELSGAL